MSNDSHHAGLQRFVVLFRFADGPHEDPPCGFRCLAEDREDAEEKCRDAYPFATILWIAADGSYRGALAALEQHRAQAQHHAKWASSEDDLNAWRSRSLAFRLRHWGNVTSLWLRGRITSAQCWRGLRHAAHFKMLICKDGGLVAVCPDVPEDIDRAYRS